ncbi:MAG: glutamate--cysteine ligase [Robiginitomaculum sp.]|nr:glutamate--cysteine ligase [Robiginitomaculum sp.]MDQ7077642.1 glutamate--cysteine ligase [Robiginitomaculum sp.]
MSAMDKNAPVEDKSALVEYLASGCKPPEDWRIGTEHEKFGFRLSDHGPLPYDAKGPSILKMLEGLQRFGWAPMVEEGFMIGLSREGATITLEPGGQFELSGAPLKDIHETCSEVNAHLKEVKKVADEMGAGFLGVGFSPVTSLEDTPIMPKPRYKIMRDYMPKVGRLGRQMMFRSCTVQVNLDFASEADMVKKFRTSLALQPVATALFANSPFADGRPNGFLSYRSYIWGDTDPDRTGMLPFVFEQGFGFEHYVDYALDVPMYFVKRDGHYLDASGKSFRDFMAGKLDILPGEKPTLKDWEDHISTLFPEVRLKTFLEMRGADGGPWSRLCALSAFWTGIFYDDQALDEAWALVKDWNAYEREGLRRTAPTLGLNAPFRETTMQKIAQNVLEISHGGLKRRCRCNHYGENESLFLRGMEDIARSGITPAEELIACYHGEWEGDLDMIFTAGAY